jgi:hypothetical protein
LVLQIGRNEPRRQLDPKDQELAKHAWWVLEGWHELPGLLDDGKVDASHLSKWVRSTRLSFADFDRADIGDEQIGRVLSASPDGSDGIWPAEPVRDLIETIGSTSIETGLHTGLVNSRGFTSRGVYDGEPKSASWPRAIEIGQNAPPRNGHARAVCCVCWRSPTSRTHANTMRAELSADTQ